MKKLIIFSMLICLVVLSSCAKRSDIRTLSASTPNDESTVAYKTRYLDAKELEVGEYMYLYSGLYRVLKTSKGYIITTSDSSIYLSDEEY